MTSLPREKDPRNFIWPVLMWRNNFSEFTTLHRHWRCETENLVNRYSMVSEFISVIVPGCTKETVVRQQILKGISGVFNAGTMTLVLGQPGPVKSALLRVLSGQFP